MTWNKEYGETEGPLGFPMKDQAAKELEELLKGLPDRELRRTTTPKALSEIGIGERADVSWISTESVDRQDEVVLSAGMDDSHFKMNPVVTLAHNYDIPPVGRSLWRRKTKDGNKRGIKAKTIYPPRPESWPEEKWSPDFAFALIQSKLAIGKSVGFITVEASPPTPEEIRKKPEWADARKIVRKWLLLEYAVHWLPVNQESVAEQISKGQIPVDKDYLKALNLEIKSQSQDKEKPKPTFGFTTWEEIETTIKRRIQHIDPKKEAKRLIQEAYEKLQGRV